MQIFELGSSAGALPPNAEQSRNFSLLSNVGEWTRLGMSNVMCEQILGWACNICGLMDASCMTDEADAAQKRDIITTHRRALLMQLIDIWIRVEVDT